MLQFTLVTPPSQSSTLKIDRIRFPEEPSTRGSRGKNARGACFQRTERRAKGADKEERSGPGMSKKGGNEDGKGDNDDAKTKANAKRL